METGVEFDTPRQKTWNLIADTDRWPELIVGIRDGERLTEEPTEEGAAFRWDVRIAGVPFSVYEHIEWSEPEHLTYASLEKSRMDYQGTIAFEDSGDGGTVVVSTLEYDLPSIVEIPLFKRVFQYFFERNIVASFENAKEILEE